jgi:RNA polymerase sigma-70 factor (ECF subfamily)
MGVESWGETDMLVRRARKGDAEAFRELLEKHRNAVTSTLFACGVRDAETARDLAQEVALKVWQKLGSLREPRTFSAWIRRIAANATRDHLRRESVRREDDLERALALADDDDPHERVERLAEIRFMLAAVADEDDEAVRLLVDRANGVSVRALAAELEITPDALKMRALRIRKRLKSRLEALRKGTN